MTYITLSPANDNFCAKLIIAFSLRHLEAHKFIYFTFSKVLKWNHIKNVLHSFSQLRISCFWRIFQEFSSLWIACVQISAKIHFRVFSQSLQGKLSYFSLNTDVKKISSIQKNCLCQKSFIKSWKLPFKRIARGKQSKIRQINVKHLLCKRPLSLYRFYGFSTQSIIS